MEAIVYLYKSGLPMEEVMTRFGKRSEKYRNVKGLLQKLYVRDEQEGKVGGIYVFDSKENLESFMNSDLEKSISVAYKFVEPPAVTKLQIVNVLFEEKKQIV